MDYDGYRSHLLAVILKPDYLAGQELAVSTGAGLCIVENASDSNAAQSALGVANLFAVTFPA